MNHRTERVNSEMQKSLVVIIRDKVKDPRVSEMVSVTKLDVAKDLKTAKVYVSIYGDADKVKSTYEGLKLSAPYIRHELSKDFKDIRTIPELNFILDESAEYGQNIERLLQQIKT